MGVESRLELLLEMEPEPMDPALAEQLLDEVLPVLRRHLPVQALEARLERWDGHVLLLAAAKLAP